MSDQGQPEAITEAELADYLETVNGGRRDLALDVAAGAIGYAKRNREPGYEPYEIYEAGDGKRWEFYADEGGEHGWLLPGQAAKYAFGFPARPLRKMVPFPSREALIAALEESIIREEGYEGQANRVLALLEGRMEACPGGC